MVELMLSTSGSGPDIRILLDFVDIRIKAFLGLYFLDGYSLLVGNVTNHP